MRKYTMADFSKAQEKLDLANRLLNDKVAEQELSRKVALNALERLDNEKKPFATAALKARNELIDMKARLLGPWDVSDKSYTANMLTLNGTDKCWDNVVWLRMRLDFGANYPYPKGSWKWVARIREVGKTYSYTKEVVLGVANDDASKRAAEFKKCIKKVEAILVKMGYILHEG